MSARFDAPSARLLDQPRHHRRLVAMLVGAALVAAGCGGSGSSDNDAGATTTPNVVETTAVETTAVENTAVETTTTAVPTTVEEAAAAEAVASKPVDPPTIEVIDEGAEPRIELRYQIGDGVYNARMSQSQSLSQSIDGQLVTEFTDLETFFEIEITSLAVDAGFEFTSLYTDIGMGEGTDPTIVARSMAQLELLIGSAFRTTIDDQGYVLDQAYLPPASATDGDALGEMMEAIAGQNQFANALPSAAMGVGGSWKQTQELSLNGIAFVQETIYTITAIDGTIVTMTANGSQTVPLGPVAFPGVPDSVEVTVETWDITTVGEIIADLTKPWPSSTATVSGTQIFVGEGSEDFELVQDLGTVVSITPVG